MNPLQASLKLSFDKAKHDLVSLKLRVNYKGDRKRYALPIKEGILISETEFERLLKFHESQNKRVAAETQKLYARILPFIEKAEAVIEQLGANFSFELFKEAFYSEGKAEEVIIQPHDVITLMQAKAEAMDAEDRPGNADMYIVAAKSLIRFRDAMTPQQRRSLMPGSGDSLLFSHLTPTFLKAYERWMLKSGKISQKPGGPSSGASITTVGIYLREVRAVYKEAIKKGLAGQSDYPFGEYTIPSGKNTKKALTKEDILKIMQHPCAEGMEQRGRDLWVFSYLSNGMNLSDICRLRWRDIDKEKKAISFVREKTRETSKAGQAKITVKLFPESLAILERWGTKEAADGDFVFPFLTDEMTARRKKEIIKQVVKDTNKHVNKIAQAVGIKGEVNTYEARHSFATILLRSEAPVAFISQALGHKNIATTEAYLGSFEDEQTQKYLDSLL
ncbi:tyrosine-type recombinase/integrase [Tellurirhabdus bombi]|uniref:tyrosine-type recombinase/integrase n=1 Tax=Tellurirhabdus bombi TaxID=2907205 RepID=UPI001F40A980|nr:site-specific integrase [Tellurirhabdus bombi]